MSKVIEVNALQKSYSAIKAVNGISFSVESGQLFSLLGENGAGKSTTINMLCTLLKHDAGSVTICGNQLGKDDKSIKSKIGIVFQESILDKELTVKQNLVFRAKFYHKDTEQCKKIVYESAAAVGATEFFGQTYGTLSGGQRRRADIARALLGNPEILFLDEPTTGLDPSARAAVWETIEQLRIKNRMTVFLTTHYMEEAANSDYIVMLDHGRILAEGTPKSLKTTHNASTLDEVFMSINKGVNNHD